MGPVDCTGSGAAQTAAGFQIDSCAAMVSRAADVVRSVRLPGQLRAGVSNDHYLTSRSQPEPAHNTEPDEFARDRSIPSVVQREAA